MRVTRVERVVVTFADRLFVAGPARERVLPAVAEEPVGAGVAREHVVAGAGATARSGSPSALKSPTATELVA